MRIVNLISVSAVHAGVVRHVDGEVRDVLVHGVVDDLLQCVDIVLCRRRQLNVCYASCRRVSGELTLYVYLLKRRHVLPYRHMDGVGEIVAVGDILYHAILGLELLHCREAEVLGRSVIDAKVQLVLFLEFLAAL